MNFEMEKINQEKETHILVLPFPLLGHIHPMLQFSKRLKRKGTIKITLALTKYFVKTAQDFPTSSFPVETFSDGFDDGGAWEVTPEEAYNRCWAAGSESLDQLLDKLRVSGSPVGCMIYNSFYPWAYDVAKKNGVRAGVFFTQSNAVNNIYLEVYRGELELPITDHEIRVRGGLPVLAMEDMPSFILNHESDPGRSDMMAKQFRNLEVVDWVFVNTFYELEQEVCDWMAKFLRVKTIGPTIPSMYLDKRLLDDKEYGISAFRPMTDSCMKWLNTQAKKSVIYVSFGTFAQPGEGQMEEMALALKASEMKFLWVVRASEETKLPKNYRDDVADKGLILTWCPQLEVLSHEAIACFITHCGWNSTLEALSLGVPMVGVPQWSDQSTNAKLVTDVWKVGIRARQDAKGVVREDELVRCVKHVIEGETGKELKENARKWMELAKMAASEGGSSDRNVEEFISSLV